MRLTAFAQRLRDLFSPDHVSKLDIAVRLSTAQLLARSLAQYHLLPDFCSIRARQLPSGKVLLSRWSDTAPLSSQKYAMSRQNVQ